MLDAYKKEGAFPSADCFGKNHHFQGPIRSHFRPRRLWPVIIMLATSYITLPPVLYALYALFCSGIVNVLIAVSLVLAGNRISYCMSKLQCDLTCLICSFYFTSLMTSLCSGICVIQIGSAYSSQQRFVLRPLLAWKKNVLVWRLPLQLLDERRRI